MTADSSLRRARWCALISAALLCAVLAAGSVRSASEKAHRPIVVYTPEYEIASFAADRTRLREQELSQLQSIALDASLGQAVRDAAALRMMELRQWMDQEAAVEQVLRARGYEMSVVTVQAASVNVVLRAGTLSREEADIIFELITRQTGITGGNVKIIPIN